MNITSLYNIIFLTVFFTSSYLWAAIMVDLSILAWNVRGIMSSTVCLSQLLNTYKVDVCMLSEHKLKEKSLFFLNSIEKGYKCIGKADSLPHGYNAYHGKGGVAILYKSVFDFYITEIEGIESERIVGIELKYRGKETIYMFAAYLNDDASIDKYKTDVDILDSLYKYYSKYGSVIIGGDLNASYLQKDTGRTNKYKSRYLCQFINQNKLLSPGNRINYQGPNYTFTIRESMLDYVLMDESLENKMLLYEILAEGTFSATSDHLPILVRVKTDSNPNLILNSNSKFPAWHKINQAQVTEYQFALENSLETLIEKMNDDEIDIDIFYETFKSELHRAANTKLPKCGFNPYTKPYWNLDVKLAHQNERYKRKLWIEDGRPRGMNFDSYRDYKRAKYDFRRVQQTASEQYIQTCFDEINNAAECDIRLFWKLMKRMKPEQSKVYPEIIYKNITYNTPKMIANAFADYFTELYKTDNSSKFDEETKRTCELKYDEL